jgi:hypothetical protein
MYCYSLGIVYILENVVYFSLGSPNVKHGADIKDGMYELLNPMQELQHEG